MQGELRRSSGRRRPGAWVLGVALVLALVACDPGEEPTTGPTTVEPTDPVTTATDEPTPTEEPTAESPSDVPTPPEVEQPTPPDEAGVEDLAGAAAFAEYFFAALDYARASGDSRLLESMVTPDCTYCANMVSYVTDLAEEGSWISSPGFTLADVRVQYPEAGSSEYIVRLVLEAPEMTLHRLDGTTESVPAETYPRCAVGVMWTSDGFRINGVDVDTDA